MIDIKKLTKKDVGKWVLYERETREPELGIIKSWNKSFIFVVYKCGGNWAKFMDYTAALTSPKDLTFCKDFTQDDYHEKYENKFIERDAEEE